MYAFRVQTRFRVLQFYRLAKRFILGRLMSGYVSLADAAVLMLKHKVHRIPVVNEADQLVGESS